jgi:hypothetical protein
MRRHFSLALRACSINVSAVTLFIFLCTIAIGQAWATAPATTTTLTVSSKTVPEQTVVTLKATVKDQSGAAVSPGLVLFYDGRTLLGTAQIVTTGSKYTHGTANLKVIFGVGAHPVKAVFAGTATYASSTSAVQTINATGGGSVTTISSTGTAGNYTLTGQVVANGLVTPTGTVSFLDQTNSDAVLGTATLATGTKGAKFAKETAYPIFNAPTISGPQQVVVADFNGDGILDLADVDYYGAMVSIHLGKAGGTFQAAAPSCYTGTPATPCNVGSEPGAIAVGDFNGDGFPDLVVADGGEVCVLIGNGDGTFQPEVCYDTATGNGTTVVVGDFDRDGIADLAVGVSGGVSILLGNGDGTFQPHVEVGATTGSDYMTIGDFNHDGMQDLALTGWNSSSLAVLPGNGDGTFQPEVDTDINVNPAGCTIVAADLKGSGYPGDLALCGSGELNVLLGKGNGTFQAAQVYYPNGNFSEFVGGLAVGDLNADGIPDLAMTWYDSVSDVGKIAVFYGKTGGTFTATPVNVNVGQEPIWVALGDFDQDGSLDLVTANEHDNTLSVVLGSDSTVATATLANVSVPGTGTHEVFASYAGDTNFTASQSATIPLTATGGTTQAATPTFSPAAGTYGTTQSVKISDTSGGATIYYTIDNSTPTTSSTKYTTAITVSQTTTIKAIATASGFTTSAVGTATYTITTANAPTITSISPAGLAAGSPAFTLVVKGTGFATGAVVKWNGSARTTAFVGSTQVNAAITAADIATAGNYSVTVTNTTGPVSNAVTLTVVAASSAPTITSLSPSYAVAGGAAFTLTVNGANFASGAVVNWGGSPRTTAFASSSKLTAAITAADIATAGSPVVNAVSGGITTNSVTFDVAPVTHTPLAYGFFSKTGTAGASSGNITCSWSSTEYLCAITGEAFLYSKYVVNATIADTSTAGMISVNSISNKVIVKIFNTAGTAIQAPFYIVVYKP